MTICFAPIFAGEYTSRADQLILSSKYGKNKQISAKLFAACSLFVMFFTLLTAIEFALILFAYGAGGANAPIQQYIPLLAYPLTMSESAVILWVCTFFGAFLNLALTLLLSSKFKSPFGVMVIISALIIITTMVSMTERIAWLHNLLCLLPTSMITGEALLSYVPYDLFGLIVLPYIFLPIYALAAIAVMLPLARIVFRNCQIG